LSSPLTIFQSLYEPLLYHGPGSETSTLRALSAIPECPGAPEILDIGCGAGRQTLQVVAQSGGRALGLDLSRHALSQLASRARKAGFDDRVTCIRASMSQLCFPYERFDLIWSEGAIYSMGFDTGLACWRPYLRPGGHVALTELSWVSKARPVEAREFWGSNYPAMRSAEENCAAIEHAGFELVECFTLPESDWWDTYYAGLSAELETFVDRFEGEERGIATVVAEQSNLEMDVLRKSESSYSYVFYIMRKPN